MDDLLTSLSVDQKKRIEELAGYGASEEDIAAELIIPLKHLQENCRDLIARGDAKGKNAVLKNLYEQAQSGTHVTVSSLWVRSRCGWRDTGLGNTTFVPAINFNVVAPSEP